MKELSINKAIVSQIFRFKQNNVLKFQSNSTSLSDADYVSLFMGIIRLIKEDTRNNLLNELNKKR